jgi:hypothetical protein
MYDVAPPQQVEVEQAVLDRAREALGERDLLTIHAPEGVAVYTVGLTDALLPELAVFDPPPLAGAWLEALANRCAEGELEIGPAMQLTEQDGGEHTLTLVRHDPMAHPDLALSRCLYGAEMDTRVIDLRSCLCARCQGCNSERGYLGDLIASGVQRLR